MKFGVLGLCLVLGSMVVSVLADEPQSETERLSQKVLQLEKENRELKQEVLTLKGRQGVSMGEITRERLDQSRQRIEIVRKAFKSDPNNSKLRKELEMLGRRLAHIHQFAEPGWEALLESGALKEGLSIEEAESLLGLPTSETEKTVEWYHNPSGRHVAPGLWARKGADGLTKWIIENR